MADDRDAADDAARPKPTFTIEDPEEGTLTYRPDDYRDYEYSADGYWLTLRFDEGDDGAFARKEFPRKRVFWIGYE